ncbi:MAG TPA: cytochrome c [Terriglobia bacterium]|nr:cytochrome c [Terriglobia bacterium]
MTRSSFFLAAVIAAVMGTVAGQVGVAGAQTAPAKNNTLWDGLYSDDQASRGNAVFNATCANCHTLDAEGNRPLSGKKFWDSYTQKTVGDLFTFIQKNMPNGNPGSLSEKTYADLVALVLKSNGIPAGMTDLVPSAVAAIPIIPKDGSTELPAGALVRIVGCLAKNGPDFVLTSATPPQRTDKSGIAPDDATRPLGEKSIALKFVFTKLDADIGKRVLATGLLIGVGGINGLNVSTVTKVADSCP